MVVVFVGDKEGIVFILPVVSSVLLFFTDWIMYVTITYLFAIVNPVVLFFVFLWIQ